MALEQCAGHLAQAGVTATLQQMDMTALDFPQASFDGAISTQVIHHATIGVMREIIDRITSLLSPRGYFVLSAPTPEHGDACNRKETVGYGKEVEPGTWVDPNHREGPVPHHYTTEEELHDLLQAYEILSLEKERWPGGSQVHWRLLAQKK